MINVTYIDHLGDDLSVVNAARVSFGKKSQWNPDWREDYTNKLIEGDRKLIHYLAEHGHYSPFGHCFGSFHVKAPIFVARQLVKHKFLRWNEISRRYVDSEPEFYEPDAWRGRSEDKKQGSDGIVDVGGWGDTSWACLTAYKDLLAHGVCPEQARMVLPQNTMTEWYWSGSLDAFADMCNLRCTGDTQLETRLVANQICDKMMKLFPVSWFALRLEK
jgi:thymidylate synthase (FAD)